MVKSLEHLEPRHLLNASLDLIRVPQEQQTYGLTGKGECVAILDTGVDYNNVAFAGRIVDGWNFVTNTSDYMDDNGHGTHVSGIVSQVAPDVQFVILKVLDKTGTGSFDTINKALQWVEAHAKADNIVAVNMSFGAGNYDNNGKVYAEGISTLDGELKALSGEGIFLAAASGNDGKIGLAYPASSPYVVSVGAVWNDSYGPASFINGMTDSKTYPDKICSFTQRGPGLDLLAPGAYVTSTYLQNSTASLAGTSMATPMVVGAAVLVKQALQQAGKSGDILSILQSTGVKIVDTDKGEDNGQHTGDTYSRIDVFAAVDKILHVELTPDENYVNRLYQAVLGRDADPGGLHYWANQLGHGMSRLTISSVIWNSPEHRANLAAAEASDDYFAKLLGREPDPGASAYFAKLPRQQAIDIIMASREYARHQVLTDYEKYLGREPSEQEIQYWLGTKLSFDVIAEAFLSSAEFYSLS